MPFITVIHSRECAPSWQNGSFGYELRYFCSKLPDNLARIFNREMQKYGLDRQMKPKDIRIVFVEHERLDINPADVHFRIELDRELAKGQREMFRDILVIMAQEKLGHLISTPNDIVLELCAGSWCGALIQDGVITETW